MKARQFSKFLTHRVLLVVLCGITAGPLQSLDASAATASSSAVSPDDKHIYVGQYDLATNLWGIRGAGSKWSATIFTNSPSSIDGAGYKWDGFDGNHSSVKAYTSIRYGASNKQNVSSESGLPYLFGNNDKSVDVLWDFTTSDEDGAGSISGKYNHTLDVFFSATNSTKQSEIRSEVMVITDSSQSARTAGWGVKDAQPLTIGAETWEVWQATQTSNGHSWHVTQFRKAVNSRHFHHDLKMFFAEAAKRQPVFFKSNYYVMMVEAGTEIKTGSGHLYTNKYFVSVTAAR